MPCPTFTTAAPAGVDGIPLLRWKLAEIEMVRHGLLIELHLAAGDRAAACRASEAMTDAAGEIRAMKLQHAEDKGHCFFAAAGEIDGELAR